MVVILLDIVVNLKVEVGVMPTTTEELRIAGCTDEAVDFEAVDDMITGDEVGQLIEDSSVYNARQLLSTLDEKRMKRLRVKREKGKGDLLFRSV